MTDSAQSELRIALVLNGGVSLAVWIGGVVHELNRLREASRGGGVSAAWSDLLGPEKLDRRVVIDLIAGTSAGGLNGAVLATAIAHGTRMPHMLNEVWLEAASLEQDALIHNNPENATSVLDGAFFKGRIDDVLEGVITPCSDDQQPVHADRGDDCVLLMTATALDAAVTTRELAGGETVGVRDGRRVYKFERRRQPPGISDICHFATVEPLATAMRATASFPVAFDPVAETTELALRGADGSIRDRRWLVDGGVLDNAPFEPLLDALLERPITAPQERVVVYVTPGAEDTSAQTVSEPGPMPNLKTILGGVLDAFRQPDQRLDHDRLEDAFTTMNLSVSQPHTVLRNLLFGQGENAGDNTRVNAPQLMTAAECLMAQYRLSRAEAAERVMSRARRGGRITFAPASPPTLTPEELPGVPDSIGVGDVWTWGVPTAARVLRWLGRAVSDAGLGGGDDLTELRSAIATARRLVTVLTSQRDEVIKVPDDMSLPEPDLIRWQIEQLAKFYQASESALSEVMGAVRTAADPFMPVGEGGQAIDVAELLVALEVLYCSFNWGGAEFDTPRFRYVHMTPAASRPLGFPVDSVSPPGSGSGTGEPEMVWPKGKLYGEQWGNFGAFASRNGRTHDWRWGRLDCVEMMVSHLMRDAEPGDIESAKRQLVEEILADEKSTLDEIISSTTTSRSMTTAGLFELWHRKEGKKALGDLLKSVDSTLEKAGIPTWMQYIRFAPTASLRVVAPAVAVKRRWDGTRRSVGKLVSRIRGR
ncbi:DUF3376 domain-containing protein [Gordonia sp. PKS22-38]|uniref:DUF3376 domain-containing protein n=1 Tax=Gordonia prachuapensis TaxID=3115651 RepID=A0ABU7MSL8_9ACTN|nr:DUF3376 domain-containing protein [Gordonia sp. PKS22-38]